MRHGCQDRLPEGSARCLAMVASSQVRSIQPVVMLRCGPVLKLPCICLEVTAIMLPPQAAAPAIKCIHREVAGNIHAFGDCIAANADRQLRERVLTMLSSVVGIGISWVVKHALWVLAAALAVDVVLCRHCLVSM